MTDIMYVTGTIVLKENLSKEQCASVCGWIGGGIGNTVCGNAAVKDHVIELSGVVDNPDMFEKVLINIGSFADEISIMANHSSSSVQMRYTILNGRIALESSEYIFRSDLTGEADFGEFRSFLIAAADSLTEYREMCGKAIEKLDMLENKMTCKIL